MLFLKLAPLAPGKGCGYNATHMEIDKSYQETLDYLYSFIDYSLKKSFRYSPEKFDLGRMRDLMTSLGDPQKNYRIIHIAGTKGKGSVAALCASAIKSSGRRVGLYTSPHLEDFTERIQVDGELISPRELTKLVEEIKPFVAAIPELTTFEITTALALLYFSRQEVEAAVLEVGLGGRLDATNICDPDVTVITSISYDHTYLLGDTLAEIAGEKAGIIKPGVPLVVSPQQDEALHAIRRIAAERGVEVIQVGVDYLFEPASFNLDQQTLRVWKHIQLGADGKQTVKGDAEPVDLSIPLLGEHQVENAATAYAALQVFKEIGVGLTREGIQAGFQSVQWPGRFEILQREPPVIIDSAHNRDSAKKLRATLEQYYPHRPVVLVFGASEDKDIAGMFTELLPGVAVIIATRSIHPRAIEVEKLVEIARGFDPPVVPSSSVEQAMQVAEREAGSRAVILITGSIFVAAAARTIWRERQAEKDRPYIGTKL
jgi:dihydrofolate synthase/folylpolyglutamate synthase